MSPSPGRSLGGPFAGIDGVIRAPWTWLAAVALGLLAALPAAQGANVLAGGLVHHARRIGAELAGGYGDQRRFPMVPRLERQSRTPAQGLGDFLTVLLAAIAHKRLRDHVGGRFFCDTVDPDGHTPHFEKMRYDRALLVPLYLRVAEVLRRPAGRSRGRPRAAGL